MREMVRHIRLTRLIIPPPKKKAGWRKSLSGGKIESKSSRLKRSRAAANIGRRIDKLENKNYSERRQKTIDKLKAARDIRMSDLSENEIALGKMLVERESRRKPLVVAAVITGGVPRGLLAAAGYDAASRFTTAGREEQATIRDLTEKVHEENKERISLERHKRDAEKALNAENRRREADEKRAKTGAQKR